MLMEKASVRKRFWIWQGMLFACAALMAAVAYLWPRLQPQGSCALLRLGNLYCPGCGATRAVKAFLAGHWGQAFMCYPPLFFFLAVWVWYEVLFVRAYAQGSLAPLRKERGMGMILLCAVVLLWFVLHNVLLLFGYDYLKDVLS